MKDKTLLGGLIFTGVGVIVIFALWFFVLRDTQLSSGPMISVPVVVTDAQAAIFELTTNSEARFTLNEELRNVPTTVVGFTRQVAGQIAINAEDLSTAVLGEILVNARTLQTDNDFRNTAIGSRILFTDQYEFIRFVPTRIEGLPAKAAIGEEIAFTVTGDLTVKEITKEVTFAVTAVLVSPTQLQGTASATINRADFALTIPEVPGVANVDEAILLEIDFDAITQ
ncbi:MAG: YceI family protein [Anaerolineales bacterium]|nr:YceI family protein [Anaerolineales bacterium]MCB8968144.1 YceI family protein [Ardenticatenaceae bacterium]